MYACIHGPSADALPVARRFSPIVEQSAPHTVTLDVRGLDRMFGHPGEIAAALAARVPGAAIAIAANPDAAICAARGFRGVNVIPYGDEAKYLGDLPLALLQPDPALLETLERWGIRRFRELAALPPIGLADRIGDAGLHLYHLACGDHERPLVPLEDPLHFAEHFELEYPVDSLEPLSFVFSRLLNDLATALASRGLSTNELGLRLQLEAAPDHHRTLRFPVPMLDVRAFLKLLQLDLAAHPPAAAVLHVFLEAEPVAPRTAQQGLFTPIAPEPERLEITLARIKAIVGENNAGTPEILDTHRPDAFRLKPFLIGAPGKSAATLQTLALRIYRPPLPARIVSAAGFPEQIQAQGIQGRIVSYAGPWRSSGEWWTQDPWARDEWDIALGDGSLYRLYQERGLWFVQGAYD